MRILSLILAITLLATSPALAATFKDVPAGHWAYEALNKAVEAGILQGYNGEFGGKKLLTRYQISVIVARILDKVPAAKAAGRIDDATVKNLQAMCIEFADELAALKAKTTRLEGDMEQMRQDVSGLGKGMPAVKSEGMGAADWYHGIIQFRMVSTDDNANLTRWGGNPDSTFFSLSDVRLGIDRKLEGDVDFHLQLDYNAQIGNANDASINEVYFLTKVQDAQLKAGAFALPFSWENNGALHTCTYTITPSFINGLWDNALRVYGLAYKKDAEKKGDLGLEIGIINGLDNPAAGSLFNAMFNLSDASGSIEAAAENDDSFGYYLHIPTTQFGLDWSFTYMDNGGDAADATAPSDELDGWQIGAQWKKNEFTVLTQYADLSFTDTGAPTVDTDVSSWFILVNYKLEGDSSITLRRGELHETIGTATQYGEELTFAYNTKFGGGDFTFEYATIDTGAVDPKDDLIQVSYRRNF